MPIFTKEFPTTTKQMSGFKCNKCGNKFYKDNHVEMQEMLYWKDTGGYGSIWGDSCTYEIVLCQKCAYELLGEYAEYEDE